ncbi:ABC transporter ATP-binding protein [Nitrosomonas sp. Is37]|uniref:ABC transporter ATP-binding protein n=1 Tax=Nitrosomonas sp. Is37 TaxID=3080535 RepID=UPI00294B40FC|nr:ABC transporter ATP-binding protein [Nitrosomonas sp. Is37]MDV6344217.1 ABC transporter ATP-binding protein [Nitrosomonas sp. Is37]
MVRLQLEDIGAGYGQELVVSGISTPTFSGGEVIAVIGPNAAGKSTLFKRIAGLLKGPGKVLLDGAHKGVEGICYMPQETTVSARLTVYESVLLARKQHASWSVQETDLIQVDQALATLGIAELAFRNLGELSGGQRQLVAIAQTLAREPEILLMDEPTSALDLHRQVQVLSFMRTLARKQGMIVFIAIHDLNQALRFSDQVLVVAAGKAWKSGICTDVITVEMLREVYQIEARIERCSMGISHVIVDGVV